MKSRNLIFLTAEFPYGTGETFIENELPFLMNSFDKIIIISNKTETKTKRAIPDSIETLYFSYHLTLLEKLKSLQGVFLKVFWEEIKTIKTQYKLKLKWSILKTVLSTIQKKKKTADFITFYIENKHTHDTWLYSYWLNDMAAGIAELKKRMPHLKAFSRAHGWDVYMERHIDNYLPLRNLILKNSDACYTISNHGKSYLNKLTNYNHSEKIKLARLGTVNKNSLTPFISDDKLYLVSCSNLIPLKRIHLIIEALSLLNIPIHWTHIGSGILQKELEGLALLKLSDKQNIFFNFAGQLNNSEVLNFYSNQNVDLFINVSETEGVPVSIMEAMSFAIPVIATDVGGNSEIVNIKNGYLLSSNPSEQDIANSISAFTKLSKEERIRYRENAKKTWEDNYNAETNYPNFITDLLKL